jgi:hypothetical protein
MARIRKSTGEKGKTAVRKTRAAGQQKAKAKPTKLVKTKTSAKKSVKSAGANRAEGIRLFKLAGRPTREQFQLVYGERGHLMTWEQRAAAGVPANKFQTALAAKQSGR